MVMVSAVPEVLGVLILSRFFSPPIPSVGLCVPSRLLCLLVD